MISETCLGSLSLPSTTDDAFSLLPFPVNTHLAHKWLYSTLWMARQCHTEGPTCSACCTGILDGCGFTLQLPLRCGTRSRDRRVHAGSNSRGFQCLETGWRVYLSSCPGGWRPACPEALPLQMASPVANPLARSHRRRHSLNTAPSPGARHHSRCGWHPLVCRGRSMCQQSPQHRSGICRWRPPRPTAAPA